MHSVFVAFVLAIFFQNSIFHIFWFLITVLFCFCLQRNYRFFFMFIVSTTLLCVYVFGFCWVYIIKIRNSEDISIWRAMIKTPASIVLIIYTALPFIFVAGLSLFHTYLISTNQVNVLMHTFFYFLYTHSLSLLS